HDRRLQRVRRRHAEPRRSPVLITLTFDNGPDPGATPRVLDVLRAHGLRATFFVVGEQLRAHRALAERAHAEGHWIGNHTLTHPRPLGEAGDAARPEIEATQAELGALAHPDRLFRPSGAGGSLEPGLLNRGAVDALVGGGYTCVLWNAVPGDWADPDGWVERALAQCAEHEWTLLVLHDVAGAAAARLPDFLDRVEGAFRQDFPPDCVPIRRGEVTGSLAGLISDV
ncbi:MAG TPA: polysaccharide deacetylase family protein, partial [Solirubrobacter sp.]|nr:polysaccharide deacetylase family protein [Solirubrobacter sp.]